MKKLIILAVALAVVATAAIAIMIFNISCCAVSVACASSDPANINVYMHNVKFAGILDDSQEFAKFWLENRTGGNIFILDAVGNGAFAENTGVFCSGKKELSASNLPKVKECPLGKVEAEEFFELDLYASNLGTYSNSTVELTYEDEEKNQKNATITCSGQITIFENTLLGKEQARIEDDKRSCCR